MKKTILILLIFAIITTFFAGLAIADPLDIEIKNLKEAPLADSKEIFSFPVEIRLLDINEDATWFKVKIAFSFALLHYEYTGWCYIPAGDILAKRLEK